MLYESVQQPPEIVTLTKRKTEKAEVLVSCFSSYLKVTKRKISAWTRRWFGDKWGRIRWFYLWLVNLCSFMLETKNEISEVSHHTKQNWKLKKEKNTIIPTSKNNITLVRARHSPQLYDLPSNYFLWYEFIHWSHSKKLCSILLYF